jgi:glycosyltransferase involved in cell wall biosynthesis
VRILYLHQFFVTRAGTGGTRSYEFARRLVESGHAVTMVTAAAGKARRHSVDGIDVLEVSGGHRDYVRATAAGYGRRIAGFSRFAGAATAAAVRAPRPDVVFATSPPLTMAFPAIAAAQRHRVPLVFEVRDLWPEAPIQMGALQNPAAQRAARILERRAYRAAAKVVALSPGMVDGVMAAGIPRADIALIPNAADLDLFSPELDPGPLRGELSLEGKFVAAYFGTMGEANDLDQVVAAAAVLRERGEDDVAFVLQGDGKRRPALEAAIRERGLGNVILLPAGDKRAAARLAAASDACLTIFKDVPILATNSPNKLFDTFAAGRPAIVNSAGWQRSLVEDNDAGLYARTGDPADLAARVLELRDDPARARKMGANGRALAEREFGRDLLADRFRALLEEVARR